MKVGGGGCHTQTTLLIAKNHYNIADGIVQMRCKNSERTSPFSLEETQSSDPEDDQFVKLCRIDTGKN
jgi:hypothetical protein